MPLNPNYQREAKAILDVFMRKALAYEKNEMTFLATKWNGVSEQLESMITKLAEKEIKSLDELYRLEEYQQFLKESKYEVDKFNRLAAGTIEDGQEFFAHLGLDSTQEMIELVTVRFHRIPFNAVNNMIGLSSEGSKLYDLLKKSYPESVDKLTNALINGTALGWNPRKTARLMAKSMDGNLVRALRIARTEQMNVLRMTSLEQMKQSGVVKGWIRIEQDDACDGCADVNGKHYSFEESWDADYNHPNCRGAAIPDI